MTCAEYQRRLSPYLDNQLDAAQKTEMETHLSGCAGCTRELESLRTLMASLRTLGQVEAPADLAAGVRQRLAATPRWQPRLAWRPVLWMPGRGIAMALTAVLVMFAVAVPFYLRESAPGPKMLASKALSDIDAVQEKPGARTTFRSDVEEGRKKDAEVLRSAESPQDEYERSSSRAAGVPVGDSKELKREEQIVNSLGMFKEEAGKEAQKIAKEAAVMSEDARRSNTTMPESIGGKLNERVTTQDADGAYLRASLESTENVELAQEGQDKNLVATFSQPADLAVGRGGEEGTRDLAHGVTSARNDQSAASREVAMDAAFSNEAFQESSELANKPAAAQSVQTVDELGLVKRWPGLTQAVALQWTVRDPVLAMSTLHAFAGQKNLPVTPIEPQGPGARSTDTLYVTLVLPVAQYPSLVEELAKQGTLAPMSMAGASSVTHEKLLAFSTPSAAATASPAEQFVTVSITIIPPIE